MITDRESEPLLNLPILPLRDVVVFPYLVIPLFVGREKSIRALERAMETDKRILLITQRDEANDDPDVGSIYSVGTVSTILQLLKLPDNTVKVLVEGGTRAKVVEYSETEEYFSAYIEEINSEDGNLRELEVLSSSTVSQFEKYVKLNKKIPPEILSSLTGIKQPDRLADTICANLTLRTDRKQELLELVDTTERLKHLLALVQEEMELLQVASRIRGRVKRQMEKSQREYYLNEQMKAIQKELGDSEDDLNEAEELARKINRAGMTQEAKKKAVGELNKLKMMSPMSAEATVVRNYLDWLVGVPWKKRTRVKHNLTQAQAILEEDHYGLEKVKERILEYLAVILTI